MSNFEMFFVKPSASAKAKAQTRNIRIDSDEITQESVEKTMAQQAKDGFSLRTFSIWDNVGQTNEEFLSDAVELAKAVGFVNPTSWRSEVESVNDRGEPRLREVWRIGRGKRIVLNTR
jgi:hypothetical protein